MQNKKVLLVLDNCSAHHMQLSLTTVAMLFLPPNATSKIQLLHIGIIHTLMVSYQRRIIQWMLITLY